MALTATQPSDEAAARVLTKAVVRAARLLGLSQRSLAAVLGISESSASRLARGRKISPDTKEGELAVLFVRAFRSLDAVVGGQEGAAREWMHAGNRHLGGQPIDLVTTVPGLVRVVDYLDAMRGKS